MHELNKRLLTNINNQSAVHENIIPYWDINVEMQEPVKILKEKGYPVIKLRVRLANKKSSRVSFLFGDINQDSNVLSLPNQFAWRASERRCPDFKDEIFYKGVLPAGQSEMKALVDELIEWAKALPKLFCYRVVISPIFLNCTQEAENIFYDELNFDMVTTEPVNEEDEKDKDEAEEEKMYYLEAVKYIHEKDEVRLTEATEKLISSSEYFCTVDKIFHPKMY